MGQELIVPDSFKNFKPPAALAGLNPEADNLASGIGQAYGVLGYKGKTWSLRIHGDRHNFIRKDDGTPVAYLDATLTEYEMAAVQVVLREVRPQHRRLPSDLRVPRWPRARQRRGTEAG